MVPSHRSAVPKPQTPEQVFAAAIVALVLGVILFLVTYKVYKAIVKLHANHSITATTTAVTVAARVGVGAGADDEVEGEVEGEHEHGHDGHHIEMDDCEFYSLTLSSQHPHASTDCSVVRFSLPPTSHVLSRYTVPHRWCDAHLSIRCPKNASANFNVPPPLDAFITNSVLPLQKYQS